MSTFFKVLAALSAFFGAIIGAIVIFDRISNKNRIKGDYLDCETAEDVVEIEDEAESEDEE